ncbi:MAG: tRNA (N6-threonylcarbamoyladenosine(37)-N6)-methyltransferase TrmO [Dehalococcoidia bacterium]
MAEAFIVRPIGVVHSPVKEPRREGWESVESAIVVHDRWASALDGLEAFSHIFVIYWMHLVSDQLRETTTHVHPRGDPRNPLQGVFATRSPVRPNPIGLKAVALLERNGNALRVRGLDAIDGTPVLDLKPYLFYYDGVPDSTVPDWVQRPAQSHAPLPADEEGPRGGS